MYKLGSPWKVVTPTGCKGASTGRLCCTVQVIAHLEPLQQRYSSIMEDEGYLDSILAQGAGRLSMLSHSACTTLLHSTI